jgi:PKD repeat protein
MKIVEMQGRISMAARWLVALTAALGLMAILAPGAGAVLVHVGHSRVAGVLPLRWIKPASIPGTFAHRSTASAAGTLPPTDNGTLAYHSGSVLHAESPYLIFWDPSGTDITTTEKTNLEQYFTDTAAASGASSNIFGVDRQFTDTTGFANYNQTWSAAQAITDTQAYPTTSSQCKNNNGNAYTETHCLLDSQIQTEVQRLIDGGLPAGTSGSAPIYFVVTPRDVNTCFDPTPQSPNPQCADNVYCAYHGSFVSTGTGHPDVLYANMPMLLAANDPKGCQFDGNTAVQQPNGNSITDVVTSSMSHEFSETITDPVNGGGWYDSLSGNEDGDNCAFTGTQDPAGGSSPNAFLPTLGGSSASGTLYDQLINSDHFYTQTEWSNGDIGCKAQPTSSSLAPAFTAPSPVAPGTSVTFDPSSSSSSGGYTSTSWDFGDGSPIAFTRAAPALKTHTFTSPGTYTVKLTVVDKFGNLSTVSHTITVAPISAAFTATPTHPLLGQTVTFDASSSVDSEGTINSYQWTFGDGSSQTTNSQTVTHPYASSGPKTVTLKITDTNAHTDTTTQTITVDNPPAAAFSVTTPSPRVGSPVSFDGSGSNEPGGSISSYSWGFGDGATDTTSGAHPSHTYALPGTYNVTLTVADPDGHTASVTHAITVAAIPATPAPAPAKGVPTAVISVATSHPVARVPVAFSGSGSKDTGSSLTSYRWSFGDGSTSSQTNPSHTYAKPGSYTVRLTVTDASGSSETSSQTVSVASAGMTGVKIKTGKRVEQIKFTLSGPGMLSVGSHRYKIGKPETFIYKLKLSPAQRATLNALHLVKIKLLAKFTPISGASSRRTVRFTVNP